VELVDAEMSVCFFRLLQAVEFRVTQQPQLPLPKNGHLELGILYYFECFRKRYLGITATRRVMLNPSVDTSVFSRLSQQLSTTMDEEAVVNAMLQKILLNLKFWANDEHVIRESLALLGELSAGCMSSKICSGLDTCQAMLRNHSVEQFPFMTIPSNHRSITLFYVTLARLAFKLGEDADFFEQFMKPFADSFAVIEQQNLRSPAVKELAIRLCQQLQGVIKGANLKRNYLYFYDWLYPRYVPVLLRLLETWWDTPDVTTPILKLYGEFVHNRSQRITFNASSPNGILLFRETSKIISIYASRIVSLDPAQSKDSDFHKERLKGVSLSLRILHRSLAGAYVNFGVFALYGDKALSNALNSVLKLTLAVPLEQLMIYTKVRKDFFTFLEILYRNHLDLLMAVESKVLWGLTGSLHEGLHVPDVATTTNCAAGLDHLFTFMLKTLNRPKASVTYVRQLQTHLQHKGDLFNEILASLFNRVLFDNVDNIWSMSRPILSCALVNGQGLEGYQVMLSNAQIPEVRPQLFEAFQALMEGISPTSLSTANRERFSEHMSKFRASVIKYCVSPR
jgi:exportin-7